jgi:hypothetical protein
MCPGAVICHARVVREHTGTLMALSVGVTWFGSS